MKKVFLCAIVLLFILRSFCQDIERISDSLLFEGKQLYQSEMTSWYGTDIFINRYKNTDNIGGYFSYQDGAKFKCIFFSRAEKPKVIGEIIFDDTFSLYTAIDIISEREFTTKESELYAIRKAALNEIKKDHFFKYYENTDLNLVPMISNGERKVYVLTGPKKNGVIIFGNDYLITFNDVNEVVTKKMLHQNIITIDADNHENTKQINATMHTHLPETGDFITATDICTLMLYGKFTTWTQHYVISKNYVSIWGCKRNNLVLLTTDSWNEFNTGEENKKQKGNK